MSWFDRFDPSSPSGMQFAGLLGGLNAMGAGLMQAGQMRPVGTPAPTFGDALGAFGQGQQRGLLGAQQQQAMQKQMARQGLLAEARGDKPDDQISGQALAMRKALALIPESVRALADDEMLPGLAVDKAKSTQRPMTIAEMQEANLRPGTAAYTSDWTGAPNVVQQSDTMSDAAFNQKARLTAMSRTPTVSWRDERDGAGNLIGQRSSTGQFQPINAPALNPGQAVTVLSQIGPKVADGTIKPGTPEFERYTAAWAVVSEPKTEYVPDPNNPGMLRPTTRPRMMIPPNFPDPSAVMAQAQGGQVAPPQTTAAPPPQAAQAAPAPAPVGGVPISPGGPVAAPPQPGDGAQVPPLPRQMDGSIRVSPQATEQVRKGELEAARVADAIANFRRVLKEAPPGFNTWINNPTDPKAMQVMQAYERVKMTMRGESLMNTGVLQPGENVMLENMLLSPSSWRGAVAPYASYDARMGEIEKMVLDGYNASRKQVGLPPLRSLSGVGAGAAAAGAGGTGGGWSIRPVQ